MKITNLMRQANQDRKHVTGKQLTCKTQKIIKFERLFELIIGME